MPKVMFSNLNYSINLPTFQIFTWTQCFKQNGEQERSNQVTEDGAEGKQRFCSKSVLARVGFEFGN